MNRSLTRVSETGMTTVALPEATDLAVVASDRGAMIFGGTALYEARVLGRVDRAWAPIDVPGQGQITSYAKAPDGTEWIAVHNEPGDNRGKVFARAPGARWQPVDWQSATATYGTSPDLDRLWIAEGSVWITTYVDGVCHHTKGCLYRSLLLRTGSAAPSLSLTPRMP
jgi:hypothetical protein